MTEQNIKNHAKLVPGFHIVTTLVILASLVISIVLLFSAGVNLTTILNFLIVISIGLLFFFIRQFATGNQDRIIRAEENFRNFRLTGKEHDNRLTKSQIIALRFANDEEYETLKERAIKENLSAVEIKKAVQRWRADHHRI